MIPHYQVLSMEESPTISLIRGHTYEFDVQLEDDNSFFLSTSDYQDDTYADEYLTGVTNSRVNNGKLIFQVPMTAPTNYFITLKNIHIPETLFGLLP